HARTTAPVVSTTRVTRWTASGVTLPKGQGERMARPTSTTRASDEALGDGPSGDALKGRPGGLRFEGEERGRWARQRGRRARRGGSPGRNRCRDPSPNGRRPRRPPRSG